MKPEHYFLIALAIGILTYMLAATRYYFKNAKSSRDEYFKIDGKCFLTADEAYFYFKKQKDRGRKDVMIRIYDLKSDYLIGRANCEDYFNNEYLKKLNITK